MSGLGWLDAWAMTRPCPVLLVSSDEELHQIVVAAANAVDCPFDVLTSDQPVEPTQLLRARLVILGLDALDRWTPVRGAAEVVLAGCVQDDLLRPKLAQTGADRALSLPAGRGWLLERLRSLEVSARQATPVVGVVGAVGGAGASTLAALLAQRLTDEGAPVLLLDLDPGAGGLGHLVTERLIHRFDDAATIRAGGRGPAIVSGHEGDPPAPGALTAEAAALLDSWSRSAGSPGLLDLPRMAGELHPAWGLADRAVVVLPNRLRAVQAAAGLVGTLAPFVPVEAVVRAERGGLWLGDVEDVLGLPVLRWPDDRRVRAAGDDGEVLRLARSGLARRLDPLLGFLTSRSASRHGPGALR